MLFNVSGLIETGFEVRISKLPRRNCSKHSFMNPLNVIGDKVRYICSAESAPISLYFSLSIAKAANLVRASITVGGSIRTPLDSQHLILYRVSWSNVKPSLDTKTIG